jgi:phage regulator Rha-like protein
MIPVQAKSHSTAQLLPIRVAGQFLTISSQDFATGLDIQHKNLLETIRAHKATIEDNFGLLAFETEAVNRQGSRGKKYQAVIYLTEDQALFVGTLSRNSARVVAFKATLVRSFSEARRQMRDATDLLKPTGNEQRIRSLEQQLNQILATQQQAVSALLDIPRSTEIVPTETTRAKVQRLVNAYCRAKNVGQPEVWRKVYDRLYYAYRISIRQHKKSARESWLDVADRCGHIDKIYAIVSHELTL